jgi:hypothetical protein
MNSALQCLLHTIPLTKYFLERKFEQDINKTNPLGMEGRIPESYSDLIYNIWTLGLNSYSPKLFKSIMGERNQTFEGYGQQDSHELLQTLLDGLHEDLNKGQKQYVQDPEMGSNTEQEYAKECWEAYRKRNDSVIVDLFQGQLKSKTECLECGHKSVKFDPYMYLQLPIPEPKTQKITINVVGDRPEKPRLMVIDVGRNADIAELKAQVSKKLGWGNAESVVVEIFNSKIHKGFEDDGSVNEIHPRDIIVIAKVEKHSRAFNHETESVPLSCLLTLDDYSSSTFGVPLMIPVPDSYTIGPEDETVQEFGKVVYLSIVDELRRYALIPLYRKIGTDVTFKMLKEACDREDMELPFPPEHVSKEPGEEWEPIPDLFQVILRNAKYSYQKNEVKIYPYEEAAVDTSVDMDADESGKSPVSDLSELTHKFNGLDEISKDFIGPVMPVGLIGPVKSGEEKVGHNYVVKVTPKNEFLTVWKRNTAEFLFGKSSITKSYSDASAFDVLLILT